MRNSFTEKQRKQIYLESAEASEERFKQPGIAGIKGGCVYLGERMYHGYLGTSDEDIEAAFPEFFLFKPFDSVEGLWWTNNDERVLALLFAAAMTETK